MVFASHDVEIVVKATGFASLEVQIAVKAIVFASLEAHIIDNVKTEVFAFLEVQIMIKNNGIYVPRGSNHCKCVNRACHSKSKALEIIVIASVQVAIPDGQQPLQ